MTKKAHFVGAVIASAGMLATGAPASADSVDNDGINIGNDNNIELLPVQLCGNNIAVLGVIAPIASPQSAQCVQAPITDHPETGGGAGQPPSGHPQPAPPERPAPAPGPSEPGAQLPGGDNGVPGAPVANTPGKTVIPASSERLPEAPTPTPVRGHHAVTG